MEEKVEGLANNSKHTKIYVFIPEAKVDSDVYIMRK